MLLSLFASLFLSLFFIFYTNIINKNYFEDLALEQISQMRRDGYDEYTIHRAVKIIGSAKKYHLKELSFILGTLIRSLAVSLILTAFFLRKSQMQKAKDSVS